MYVKLDEYLCLLVGLTKRLGFSGPGELDLVGGLDRWWWETERDLAFEGVLRTRGGREESGRLAKAGRFLFTSGRVKSKDILQEIA